MSPPSLAAVMLVLLDWDETLTCEDTLSLIPSPNPTRGPPFDHYTQPYLADLEEHSRTHALGPAEKRVYVAKQLEFLGSLEEVEMKSVQRVERGGLFEGWDPQQAEGRAAERVQFRPGVSSSLSSFLQQNRETVETAIISVSWSARFIRAGLKAAGVPIDAVCANEIQLDESGRGTGMMTKSQATQPDGATTGGIRTGMDKLREMRRIAIKHFEDSKITDKGQLIVYAGDSNTDLPCLLAASVGIVVASDSEGSLESTLHRLKFSHRLARDFEAFKKELTSGACTPKVFHHVQDIVRVTSTKGLMMQPRPVLVKVLDWVQGTQVLEELQRWSSTWSPEEE
ncbi:unnamed protein product [Parajaminaea phylloscopi]